MHPTQLPKINKVRVLSNYNDKFNMVYKILHKYCLYQTSYENKFPTAAPDRTISFDTVRNATVECKKIDFEYFHYIHYKHYNSFKNSTIKIELTPLNMKHDIITIQHFVICLTEFHRIQYFTNYYGDSENDIYNLAYRQLDGLNTPLFGYNSYFENVKI